MCAANVSLSFTCTQALSALDTPLHGHKEYKGQTETSIQTPNGVSFLKKSDRSMLRREQNYARQAKLGV